MLIALVLGIAIPAGILFLREFFKYKIEGHEDVMKLTQIPVIADIPVASDAAKKEGKADIVVHQNVNNLMEEIFRGLRTNIQFMLKEGEKVMMFTSSTSGEGKTFVASISVSRSPCWARRLSWLVWISASHVWQSSSRLTTTIMVSPI